MFGGVYIDDAGTPGTASPSAFLHTFRKSWAAVIVPDDAVSNVSTAMEMFLTGVATDYGVNELHFSDIYAGRGCFERVAIEERFQLFDLMTDLFEKFQLPIFFQTCSPEFLSEHAASLKTLPKITFFDFGRHDHISLLWLLIDVRKFIVAHNKHFKKPLRVIIDEGLCKAGFLVKIPQWKDLFTDGQLEFRKSHECAFLQLADFAAFVISRGQWLLGRGNLKPRDIEFLRIVSGERLCVINLPLVQTFPDRHTTEIYDHFLKKDRQAKGFKPDPPKLG
jgi:hypothetical protein